MRSPLVQTRGHGFEDAPRCASLGLGASRHRAFSIPCFPSPELSSAVSADVFICDVTQGPTCSWKDCVAPFALDEALRAGHRGIVVASSGNHGRAIAHVCRAAGLEAAVLVYERTRSDVVDSLLGLGAKVYRYADRAAVHEALAAFRHEGWHAATLLDHLRTGAAMPGAIGYQRIARSIADAAGGDPIVVVPTCYGDGATAIREHLCDLGHRATMCLVRAAAGDHAAAASIATNVLTPQVAALKASGAIEVDVADEDFYAGLPTMNSAVGKRLDLAEGGTPTALVMLARTRMLPGRRPVVCVVTGALYPGLGYGLDLLV